MKRFNQFQSKILLAFGKTVLVTTAALVIFFLYKTENQVKEMQSTNAKQLLGSVIQNVENEYKGLQFYRDSSLQRRKHELKTIVELALVELNGIHQEMLSGTLTEVEAKERSAARIKQMRFDNDVGYLWINDMTRPIPTMIMHPTIPRLDGQRLDDPIFNCAQGVKKNLFQAFVEVCAEHGEGFVDYLWPKPTSQGLTSEQPKLSYVKLFKPWNWVVGTGIYIDDLDRDVQNRLTAILLELEEAFSKIDLGRNGYMFLFNGGREILVQPKALNPLAAETFQQHASKPVLDNLAAASATEGHLLEYSLELDPRLQQKDRDERLAVVMHFEPLDWYIVSSMDADEFNAPTRSAIRQVLILGAAILVGALFFSLRLSHSLSDPLQRLAAAAQNIDFQRIEHAEVPVDGTIETKNLGRVLNTMLASIRESARNQEEHFKSDLAAINRELMQSNQDLQKEIEERKHAEDNNLRLERQLLQAEKLEAIGRLAAGIAHEINTPTQYVSTNIVFLKEAMQDLDTMLANIKEQLGEAREQQDQGKGLIEGIEQQYEAADWEYLQEEIPSALEQSEEGLQRISTIVLAMKNFSHPGSDQLELADINANIRSTVTVAKNEWKYVADLDLQLEEELPSVPCFHNELNQVFLNLIINGVHAIAKRKEQDAELKGLITIATRKVDNRIEIEFSDNGIGIPEDIQNKIFEPFFTTKEVGKGTGQGLAIAHDVVVKMHHGTIDVQSQPGQGAAFRIALPINHDLSAVS